MMNKVVYLFDHSQQVDGTSLASTDVRAMLKFDTATQDPLLVKVGISAVDNEGSSLNAGSEIPHWDFEEVASEAKNKWNQTLGKFIVEEGNAEDLVKFYTGIFHWSAYPMTYSYVDGRYRGPNEEIQLADNFIYYGAVMGLWDTFRAANPLLVNTKPEIANDYILTFLAIYQQSGLLPVWVLQSHETLTMIGYHSMPVIADTYFKGIRDYDVESVYDAMVNSACKDSFGISMGRVMGTKNYKEFAYIPADLEYESVAQTLEYAYDDWCIARMARMLGKDKDYKYFMKRAGNYRHVFDLNTGFMRGRMSDGSWREPFDPFSSHHRRDDYCEGTAWQWTFFVPHDVKGLAKLLGGRIQLAGKLDSLFKTGSQITSTKGESSGDISGLIGQYAHGNEPSHHIPYMYNDVGQPWKTQKLVHEIMDKFYKNSPLGYSGNEDTGQVLRYSRKSASGMGRGRLP